MIHVVVCVVSFVTAVVTNLSRCRFPHGQYRNQHMVLRVKRVKDSCCFDGKQTTAKVNHAQ
jgi:hypothetical protein